MKILVASPLFPPALWGGAETAALETARGLARRGHGVTVLTTRPNRSGRSERARFGLPTLEIGHHNLYWRGEERSRTAVGKAAWHLLDAWNPALGREIGAVLDRFAPDVQLVHNFSGLSAGVWAQAAKRGIPSVQVLHDHHLVCIHSDMLRRDGTRCASPVLPCRLRMAFLRRAARGRIAAVAAPSNDILDRHRSFGFFGEARAAVIPNGSADPLRAGDTVGRPEGERRIVGALGALEPNKGIVDFAKRFAQGGLPKRGWIFAVGGDGSQRREMEAIARAEPAVRYLGFLDGPAKRDFFRSLSALIMPSRCIESFGLVLVESAAHGVPVLAAAGSGGPEEIVLDGETGWVVDFEEVSAVEARLSSLGEDRDLWRRMSEASRQRFLAEYALDVCVDRYEALLGRVAERRLVS